MEVRWSLKAVDDLERIARYIEQDNAQAAQRVARAIYERATGLQTLSQSGQTRAR